MSTSTCFVESVTGAMIVSDVAPQQPSSFDHQVQTSPFRRPITPPRLQQQQQQQQQQQGLRPPQPAPYLNYQLPPPQTMSIQPNQPISTAIVPTSTALVPHIHHQQQQHQTTQPLTPKMNNDNPPRSPYPHLIATISAGFERGDYLIREEKGSNIYFDFFEEAYNFISTKGYRRMHPREEEDYMDVVRIAHRSVPGGMRFNSGKLLMVLKKELVPIRKAVEQDDDNYGEDKAAGKPKSSSLTSPGNLRHSTGTLPTDADSCSWDSSSSPSKAPSQNASSAYSSYVDSWE